MEKVQMHVSEVSRRTVFSARYEINL